jgi:hypothetical protein
MRAFSKTAVVLLLASMAFAPQAEHWFEHGNLPRQAGSCHQERHVPRPQPVDYTCCQVGHRSAVLQKLVSISPSLVVDRAPGDQPGLPPVLASVFDDSPLSHSSSSPPGVTTLRI